jgi:hypothetical protein
MNKLIISMILLLFFFSTAVQAQHQHHAPPPKQKEKPQTAPMQHEMHHMEQENSASHFLMGEGAGTATNPSSYSMHMTMKNVGKWNLMTHGYAFLNVIEQSGPRGDDDVFSSNHLMLMAERQPNSKSSVLFRAMLSLEPGTVQDGRYPLLFQTGETAEDRPIVDGQHPHDLFMELSAQYALQLNENTLVHFYAGLRGDPALGPVAYPHRLSAQELPQAALSHHLQDSSHIADDVLTAGIRYKDIRFEFSGFHGAEPDEDRWDLDQGAIDSWSTRVTFTPTPEWAAQISTGHLNEPEELEEGDIQRTTLAVTNFRPLQHGSLASSFVWGWNHKIQEDLNVYSYLFETLWQFRNVNYATARFEVVDKEELFVNDPHSDLAHEVFTIKAFTFGYARDFNLIPGFQTGIGANVTFHSIPDELNPVYDSSPKGFLFYLRIRSGHLH